MLIIAAILGAALWGACIFWILYLRQTPRAQVRRRILAMIERAEAEQPAF